MTRRLAILALALIALGPGPAAGNESSVQPFSLTPPGDLALLGPEESRPSGGCDGFKLFLADERPADCPPVASTADTGAQGEATALRKPWYYSALAWGAPIGLTAAGLITSLTDSPLQSFRFASEGWFGPNTYAGGADKAAHFVNYTILSKEMAYMYQRLGYSNSASVWLGFGSSVLEGLANEFGDGFNRYGFSWGDATMDITGSAASALILATSTEDLFGFRNGFLLPKSMATCCQVPGKGRDYSYGIYTVDLKLAGVGRRLGLNIGPLRYLYFSVTYGSKFYPSGPPDLRERQVGFEIGLNFEQILDSLGVSRERWWGYGLHVILDNIRFPFTSVGFQYDLNHGKWHGPGNGNQYSTTP
jgi:uncharacterized protein YfiM (DUF2279 family)